MTQKEQVEQHLRTGRGITQLQALGLYKTFRLSAIIYTLKKEGMDIISTRKKALTGNHYVEYSMKETDHWTK